jgi:hypothetical protein
LHPVTGRLRAVTGRLLAIVRLGGLIAHHRR